MAAPKALVVLPRGSSRQSQKLHILDLPVEALNLIFKHSSSTDLISLSLVSHRFREIAAAQLYRNFHIVFPDDDDPSYDSPIDGLAGGLDTFVTSDFDYAQFLREIVLDTLSGGFKGERAYRPYLYEVSCGKFLNTLLLLTLRKAKSLETFKWNIRVELSRQIFKALHQTPALQNLHLRMQAGPSMYEAPPALHPSSEAIPVEPPVLPASNLANTFSMFKPPPKYKFDKPKKPVSTAKQPPTLSGFRSLKSLAILDMDTLDYIDELSQCIHDSSSTLSKLKISFSESLADQARKPPPDIDPDDSDQEIDDFGNPIAPPNATHSSSDDVSGPAKAFRAQKIRKEQEAVLGRIFRIGSDKEKAKETEDVATEDEIESDDDPSKTFIKGLRSMAHKLMSSTNGPGPRTQHQREALEIIEKAAKLYVEKQEKEQEKNVKEMKEKKTEPATIALTLSENSESSDAAEKMKHKGSTTNMDEVNPEDIDIEKPEQDESTIVDVTGPDVQADIRRTFLFESDTLVVETEAFMDELKTHEQRSRRLSKDAQETRDQISNLLNGLRSLISDLESVIESDPNQNEETKYKSLKEKISVLRTSITSQTAQLRRSMKPQDELKDCLVEAATNNDSQKNYVRSTRGLSIRSLAIYLIPIRTSVLSKAINIHALKRLVLLNVGPQAPFWAYLTKENKGTPLQLQKLQTDNVTTAFLTFVSELRTVTELFLLERNVKSGVESFAPKTDVMIADIRHLALKKHISTIKKLMIRNDNDYSWDIDKNTALLICKRGQVLEELAVGFGVRTAHVLMQYLTRLTSLRAFHITTFRTDDTCMWVMRELRRFIVDNASHNPAMKLEYLALDNTVERLLRPSKKNGTTKKGKGKAASAEPSAFDLLLHKTYDSSSEEEESSETDEDNLPSGLRLDSIEGLRFYDVYDVRIFKKDIMVGRL